MHIHIYIYINTHTLARYLVRTSSHLDIISPLMLIHSAQADERKPRTGSRRDEAATETETETKKSAPELPEDQLGELENTRGAPENCGHLERAWWNFAS